VLEYPILQLPGIRIPQNREPLGSKKKLWLRYPQDQEPRVLFKYNRPGTGEDWSEKIAAELAQLLGVPHSRVELSTFEGQPGAALYDFTDNRRLALVHGNELLEIVNPEYPGQQKRRAAQHTVQAVLDTLARLNVALPDGTSSLPSEIGDAADLFVGYLMLDAWIGNVDRHHENWGLLWHPDRPSRRFTLAPSYDHASSLGRELTDDKRTRPGNPRHGPPWQRYAHSAKSAFYPGGGQQEPLKTWEAFRLAAALRPSAGRAWVERLRQISTQQVLSVVEAVPETRMTPTAKAFTCALLAYNVRLVSA